MSPLQHIKKDFPVFGTHPRLAYCDSAATTLKPKSVIDKIKEYYVEYPASVHRGLYYLAEQATEEFEATRNVVSLFIHARRPEEIVFVKNTTEGLNLLASSLSSYLAIREKDELLVTQMEHHANFIPWQQIALRTKARLRYIPMTDDYLLDVSKFTSQDSTAYVSKNTKIVALSLISNVTGTIHPVKKIISQIRSINPYVIVVVDAAQAAGHMAINVQELGADFVVFSGHKMLGPTGVGVVWGRYDLFSKLPPYQTGGGMIRNVTFDESEFDSLPGRFEAGTPDIPSVIALKTAIEYIDYIGLDIIHKHERKIATHCINRLHEVFGEHIHIYTPPHEDERSGIVSFSFTGIHPHDIAQVLDEDEIAVRAGHHCAQPLHTSLGVAATTRASFYLYNDESDVERFVVSLSRARDLFGVK